MRIFHLHVEGRNLNIMQRKLNRTIQRRSCDAVLAIVGMCVWQEP